MLVLLGNKGNNLSIHEKKNNFLKLKNIHSIKCSIANVVKTVSIELFLISGSDILSTCIYFDVLLVRDEYPVENCVIYLLKKQQQFMDMT